MLSILTLGLGKKFLVPYRNWMLHG